MLNKLLAIASFLTLATLGLAAANPPEALYVHCGKLIYDASQPPLAPGDVVIAEGKVQAVGGHLQAPAGARKLDLSAYTILPGFVDGHTHLYTGPRDDHPSDPLAAVRASKDVAYALRLGVVGMRILGTEGFIDVALARAIDEGTIPGPHIIAAAHAITIPGGHGDFFALPPSLPEHQFYTPLHGFINSPADAEAAVHLQIKYGAKVIKILASGGVMSPLDSPYAEQVSAEEMKVIVEQAHMANLKVAAHCENSRTIHDALMAGMDSIEHGAGLTSEDADYMRAHGIVLDPTTYIVDSILVYGEKAHLPDYILRKGRDLAAKQFAGMKLAMSKGVIIGAGSDMSYAPPEAWGKKGVLKGTVLDEIIDLVHHGMTPQQALIAGTKTTAALLGLDQVGSIEKGKEGDFVAVQGDPLSDIHAIENTKLVVYQGKVVVDHRNGN
ncbi:MAG: amidohydrolase family protein [Terriglobia bacterium]